MSLISKLFHHTSKNFDHKTEWFIFHHPHAAIFAMFVGLPVVGLAAVSLLAILFTLPAALILG